MPRPGAVQPWGFDLEHGIFADDVLDRQPAKKAAQGVDVGQQASIPQSARLGQIGNVLPQIVYCDLGHRTIYLLCKDSQRVPVVLDRLG